MTDTVLHNIVLFDGVCNLCNGSVLFIVKRDPKGKFRFASLQSSFGQHQLQRLGKNVDELHSIILLRQNQALERSDAVLAIAGELRGLWPVIKVFYIIPKFIRDYFYDWIAARRYRLFGRKDACMIPTPELKQRFIE